MDSTTVDRIRRCYEILNEQGELGEDLFLGGQQVSRDARERTRPA
jgi:hypothetical protein